MNHFLLFCFLLLPPQYDKVTIENYIVNDGDTFTQADIILDDSALNIVMPQKMQIRLTHESIRFENFDAWEATTTRKTVKITPEELIKGTKAKNDLKQLCLKGTTVYIL